jgi:hypothetical protein
MRASSSPRPTSRTSSAANVRSPFFAWNRGRACTTRCDPSASRSAIGAIAPAGAVTDNDMSRSVSRSVRKYSVFQRLRLSTCPSTHTGGMRAM